jgi:hypothetical protein
MIAIFSNFSKFSAKERLFLKNQCYDPNFAKTNSVLNKNAKFFTIFMGENILKKL